MGRLLALSALLLAACYETPKPACQFLCGEGDACPEGYGCGDDQRCHRVESNGSLAACTDQLPTIPDASIDAELVDALVDAEPIDAEPPDATPTCAAFTATADGSAAGQVLVITEVDPGSHIELYNNGAGVLDLGTSTITLHSPPSGSLALSTTGLMIPSGGQRTIAWPVAFTDTDAGGEIVAYVDGTNFADGTKILDFVPWGAAPTGSVQTLAEANDKWDDTGTRPGVLTMGAIHRVTATAGVLIADYSVSTAASPVNCDP